MPSIVGSTPRSMTNRDRAGGPFRSGLATGGGSGTGLVDPPASRRERVYAAGAAVLLATTLQGCTHGVLDPLGPVGTAEKAILFDSVAIMLCIVVPTILATVGVAYWFRASNTAARRLPQWAFSGRVELVTWSIPVLVILLLGGVAWISSHDLDPARPLDAATSAGPEVEPLEVQVVSLDWKWLFIYPAHSVASVNRLVIPAGLPVHLSLTSASVMNAFFVPQLGSMIYTMNGMATHLNLRADREGSYDGLSSHFSGDGFPGMHFATDAMKPDAFVDWVRSARGGTGASLDAASYAALSKQSSDVAPITFRAVAPDLFGSIVAQRLPPGPGPERGNPTPDVSPKSGG